MIHELVARADGGFDKANSYVRGAIKEALEACLPCASRCSKRCGGKPTGFAAVHTQMSRSEIAGTAFLQHSRQGWSESDPTESSGPEVALQTSHCPISPVPVDARKLSGEHRASCLLPSLHRVLPFYAEPKKWAENTGALSDLSAVAMRKS